MEQKSFYLTTPIFYPNDKLHLGHAYNATIADIIARYKKSKNYKVYFQTGSDDHGEKIEKKALSLGISPQELVDKNVELFKKLWQKLGIEYDFFYRTSSLFHKEKVQKIFQQLLKQSTIYLGKYQGNYCIACEDYVKEKVCPNCHSETKILEEPAYFLKVSQYYQQLLDYYQKNPDFLIPAAARKELFANFLQKDKIQDLCITRSDIKLGIYVPDKPKIIIYVWFEALCNYLNSEKGEKMFANENSEIIHLIGKDIVRFHALYWPVILFALGKRLPDKIIAHGLLMDPKGEKASKSKGNVVDPLELLEKYPQDLLRTYFIAKINFLQDGIFSKKLLKEFYQDFFIHNLGNLCQRIGKGKIIEWWYKNGVVPNFSETENIYLRNYYQTCLTVIKNYQQKMDNYQLTGAFQEIENLLNASNKLIQDLAPWNLFANKEIELLNLTLNYLRNGIRIIAFFLTPIAPNISQIIFEYLNLEYSDCNWENIKDFQLIAGKKIKPLKEPLFVPL
ncbi:methionine--tRNA ligase [endosymbiont GvMRE of Glomus versiforme]|uniref:methionine--tRNA ligase n=1 Tax=endosymbiont GvMRE of Glomus versiforme TaxID=2039283 RepID=UPI000EC92637|nr:methionine--tRNA ligase [endosymbiont GvMRE of Glomus versiforme]RHZ36359.1 Methionine--tRNA ligase [endosymbiont GvMRE of Glomus versiforme]